MIRNCLCPRICMSTRADKPGNLGLQTWTGQCSLDCPPGKNLVTEAEFLANWTLFTLDNATPVELTEAVLLQNDNFISIPPLTAQQVTATHVQCRAVAGSPPGPRGTCLSVWKAKVRRLSRIDQILFIWSFYVLADRDQCLSIIASHHLWCTIEAL